MIRRLLIRREDPDRAVVRPPHRAAHVLDGTPVVHDIVQRLDELLSGLTAKRELVRMLQLVASDRQEVDPAGLRVRELESQQLVPLLAAGASALFARAAFETLLHCTLPGIDGAAR